MLALDDPAAVDAVVHEALGGAHRRLVSPEIARDILRAGGLEPVPVTVLRSLDDLDHVTVDVPVALKSEHHLPGAATRRGGVDLDLLDLDEVRGAAGAIAETLGDRAWPMILQPMVAPGTDVRVSVETHPVVGPVVRVGPGGGASRFVDAPRRVLPLTDIAARDLLADSGVSDALDDEAKDHLLELVRRLAAIVDAAPEVLELSCDPVLVRPDAADIVEVRVVLQSVRPDETPPVRRLDERPRCFSGSRAPVAVILEATGRCLAGQPEHPVAQDVAQDLGGAAHDRVAGGVADVPATRRRRRPESARVAPGPRTRPQKSATRISNSVPNVLVAAENPRGAWCRVSRSTSRRPIR